MKSLIVYIKLITSIALGLIWQIGTSFLNAQTTQTYQVAGSYTWVCPANVLQIRVQCWGGGKGGSQSSYGGSGGAGGAYSSGILNVIPGNTYYINCAFGGYGNGGDTWFSNFNGAPSIIQEGFLAKGGSGFDNGSLSIGDTVFSGGLTGGFAWSGQLGCGGGGGSSAGPLGQGNNGVNTSGGIAVQGGGNGGNGTCYTYQGANSGLSPGGGGGGSVSGAPGVGAPGKLILSYILSCSGTPNSGNVSLFPDSGCGTTLLKTTGISSSPGVNYQWQSSTNDISWTDISGATSSIYTAHTNTTTYYRLKSTCVFGWSSYSNSVIYTFTGNAAQPAPSVNPITIDCGQTGIITATGGGTQDYIWFSDDQALNQVGTGASYTTPILSNSTNYYVTSSVSPQYTQNYYIEIADLINLNQYCGNGSIYGSGSVGFDWTDLLPAEANIASVSVDLSIGYECSAGLKNVTFNGVSQTGFTTASNCSCNGYAYQNVPLLSSNYVKGGTNQFRVTNASSFGFNSDNPDFLTYLARINVTYTISTPCYSDLTVAQVIVLPPPPITASSDQTICSGTSPSNIILSGNIGTVQWQVSSDNTTWTDIVGATSATLTSAQMGTLTANRYYRASVTSGACGSQFSNTVLTIVNSLSSGTIGNTQTFCFSGDPSPLTFSGPASVAGTLSYQWQSSTDNSFWSNISGESSATYDPTLLSSTMYYRAIVSSSLNGSVCNSSTNVSSVYINNPGGGVVGADQTICSGIVPSTFTVTTAASGLGTLTYQWESSTDNLNWNAISSATAATYTSSALTQTTYFRRKVTATYNGLGCSAYSNSITITVNQLYEGAVGGDQTICFGGNTDPFTVSVPSSGSGVLTYQWQNSSNGSTWSNIPGANSETYDPPNGLTSTTYFRDVITSTLNGISCTSNTATITVRLNSISGGSISGNQTICSGGYPSTFTSSAASTASGVLTYQWQSSTDNSTWGDISLATSATYSVPAPVTITTYYRRQATSNLNGIICSASSNTLTITVNNVSAGVIGTDQTVCSGGDPQTLVFTTAASGTGTLSYQWQSTSTGTSWSSVATTPTYNPPAGISLSTDYRVIVKSTLNGVVCTSTSNFVSIIVNSINPGTLGISQTFCNSGDPDTIRFTAPASSPGLLTYQWQSSTDNSIWSDLPGEDTTVYDPPLQTSTIYYRVVITSVLNGITCTSTSNVVACYINNPTGGTIGSDQTICMGISPAAFTVTTGASGLGTLTYQWESSLDTITWNSISGATAATYTSGPLNQTTYFRRKVSAAYNTVVCTTYSNAIKITVNQVNAGIIVSNQTICSGDDPDLLGYDLLIATGAGTLSYQWQSSSNGTSSWTNISGATSAQYDPPSGQTASKYYRVIVTSLLNGVSCFATSNTVSVLVNTVTPGSITGSQTICSGGDPSVFSSMASGLATGTLSYQWQYSTDNINWTNVPALPTGTNASYNADPVTVTTYYRRQTLSALNGVVCASSSNTVTVTVNQIDGLVIGSDQTICSGGVPATLTFLSGPNSSGTVSYQWKYSANGTSWITITGATGTALTSAQMGALTATRYYQVIVTSTLNGVSCSSSSNTIVVSVNSVSSGVIGSTQTVCVYTDPSILSFSTAASGSGTLSYQWQNSSDNLNWSYLLTDTLNYYDPPILSATTYYHTIVTSSLNGVQCSSTTSPVAITVNAFNPGTIGSDQTICPGGIPATFTSMSAPSGTGTFSYQWQSSSDNSFWLNIISGATAATYSATSGVSSITYYRRITYHTANGITCALPTNIVTISLPSAGSVSSSQTICSGSLPSSLIVVGATGTPLWQTSTNGTTWSTTGVTGTTLSSSQIGALSITRYYRVIISGVTCSPSIVSNSVLITVLTPPSINAGNNQSVCYGNSVTLSASGGTSYSWNNGVTNNAPFIPVSTLNYTVTGTASNGCTNTDQVLVTVNPTQNVSIVNNNPGLICQGQSFTLSSSISSGVSYQWLRNGIPITGENSSIYSGTLSGSYTLVVTTSLGCSSTSAPMSITITSLPSIYAGADQEICNGEPVTLTCSGASNYTWNNGVIDGISFSPSSTGTYTVSTTGTSGCTGTDQVVVTVNNATTSTIYTTSMGDYVLNGVTYSESGTYTQNTLNQFGCDSTITLNLTVVHAGIQSAEKYSGIQLYPNPSLSGIYFIKYPDDFSCENIRVVGTNGQLIRQYSALPSTLELSELPPGDFYIEFTCGESRYIHQIQKM